MKLESQGSPVPPRTPKGMKNKVSILLYIFFGFFSGFLLGASLDRELSMMLGRVLYACGILIVGLFWRTIDVRSHHHHLEIWLELRRRGKWYFIVTRYILLRGGLLLALFGAPLFFNVPFAGPIDRMLELMIIVLMVMMLLLGHLEWRFCEQDSTILAFKRAAEAAKQNAALFN